MSHFAGSGVVRRLTRTCLVDSLFEAWIRESHSAHSAASSAQHITVAKFFAHASHCIFIFTFRGSVVNDSAKPRAKLTSTLSQVTAKGNQWQMFTIKQPEHTRPLPLSLSCPPR